LLIICQQRFLFFHKKRIF